MSEMVRVAAPIYLKFGLSKAPAIYPYGRQMRDVTLQTARERTHHWTSTSLKFARDHQGRER
jgi:hypothetical protein